MINDQKYKEVLESGLILDHYFLLCNINDGIKPVETRRIQGFINLLVKKGYLIPDSLQLTTMAIDLVEGHEPIPVVEPKVEKVDNHNVMDWATKVHGELKDRIKQLTGKSQAYIVVHNVNYPYLPGIKDLAGRIEKFIKVYKYNDLDIIRKLLIRHCAVRNQKMMYYIMREKGDAKSDLAADYENFNEVVSTAPDGSERINPKDLF